MNITAITLSRADGSLLTRCLDYVELCKPRISVMVLLTVVVGGLAATGGQCLPPLLIVTVIGTGLVAASANIWNQWLERDVDRQMRRTVDRPLVAGRISGHEAVLFGGMLLVGGVGILMRVGWRPAALALATWILYVGVYTPLKRVTAWNTCVGAIGGALPVLIGWSATGQPWDARAAGLFLLVFFWQFPHFMAIAWKYRRDYAAAGLQMATVTDPTGRVAGRWAVWGALAVVPASVLPAAVSELPLFYLAVAMVLGIVQLMFAIDFCRCRRDPAGRRLLRMSLVYLPAVLVGVALVPLM